MDKEEYKALMRREERAMRAELKNKREKYARVKKELVTEDLLVEKARALRPKMHQFVGTADGRAFVRTLVDVIAQRNFADDFAEDAQRIAAGAAQSHGEPTLGFVAGVWLWEWSKPVKTTELVRANLRGNYGFTNTYIETVSLILRRLLSDVARDPKPTLPRVAVLPNVSQAAARLIAKDVYTILFEAATELGPRSTDDDADYHYDPKVFEFAMTEEEKEAQGIVGQDWHEQVD